MDVAGLPAGDDVDSNPGPEISRGATSASGAAASIDVLPLLDPAPVDTLDELAADYYRPFSLPGQISVISLAAGATPAEGEYSLYRSCGVPVCVPEVAWVDSPIPC